MNKVSVLLPTFNEGKTIEPCLESVKWADEILVVDSYSSDHTLEIAKRYGARIVQHIYVNSAKQKNWAIPQCSYEWVLQIDADERIEPALKDEIQSVLKNPAAGVDGYRIPFKHHMFGKWIKVMGLYPEYHLRLFRKEASKFQDQEVDAHIVVPGEVQTLQNHIFHYGFENFAQRLNSLDRYTSYESQERIKQGRTFSIITMLARSLGVFLYTYIWKRGYAAGMRGLILAVHRADFIFWTYAKMWNQLNQRDE